MAPGKGNRAVPAEVSILEPMNRRSFLARSSAAALAATSARGLAAPSATVNVAATDRARILRAAAAYLNQAPKTLTSAHSPRSAGGPHDYFSEGDYWWPDPNHPDGPYIRRDGFSNPDNFNTHRELLIRLSLIVPALTAAWVLRRERKYAEAAAAHLRAWFVTPGTRMTPALDYAQAIHGISTGRGTGIIDTLHLVEVARSAAWLERSGALTAADRDAVRGWFRSYLDWMNTSKNGIEEREAKNNHGTCWVAQYAAFSSYVGDESRIAWCRERFRSVLVPSQIAPDGRLPLELARTKPYSYSLFNMDVLSTICQICSQPGDNLWAFQTPDGRGQAKVLAFMAPYIADKSAWPFPHDVEYFDNLPVRQPSLLFGGLAYQKASYIALWKRLNPDPTVPEIIRNFPIRQPLLWVRDPV